MEAVADESVLVVPALHVQAGAATSRPEVLTTAHTGVAATGHVVCQGDFFLQSLGIPSFGTSSGIVVRDTRMIDRSAHQHHTRELTCTFPDAIS